MKCKIKLVLYLALFLSGVLLASGQQSITGGCWSKKYIPIGGYARYPDNTIINDVINVNGTFYGCMLDPEIDAWKLGLVDNHTLQSLIQNMPVCTSFANAKPGAVAPHVFCAAGEWSFDAEVRNQSSSVAWTSEGQASSCCSSTSCWNGNACQPNQFGQASPDPSYPDSYRCINGTWTSQLQKMNWDGNTAGYCTTTNECLVDPFGNKGYNTNVTRIYQYNASVQLPQCVNQTQYYLDNYCQSGDWTSRTKLLAQQLLSIALAASPSNYTLYCDDYEKVLTWTDYSIGTTALTTYLGKTCTIAGRPNFPCVNNFCALTYSGGTAFGTSTNVPINSSVSILKALGLNANICNGAINNDGDFDRCDENIWYNHDTESIMYLPAESLPSFNVQSTNLIILSYYDILAFASGRSTDIRPYNSFLPTTRMFNTLYIAKQGTRSLFSFVESKQRRPAGIGIFRDWLGLKYQGPYLGDICAEYPAGIIRLYDEKAECQYVPESNTYYVVRAQQAVPPEIPPSQLIQNFQDVAGKLRPK